MRVRHEQVQEQTQNDKIQELEKQIEELTAANLLLQEQLAHKEQFTAMIAHELRGPLSPIINYAQMLNRHVTAVEDGRSEQSRQKNRKRAETIQRHTNIIIGQSWRLSRLVNDLLDTSRLSSGVFTLFRESCDLGKLIQESVEQLRPIVPYHQLIAIVPTEPVQSCWDAGRIQQALGNLLDNAVKYSDEGTVITVRVWTTSEGAHVSVHNQGVSIPSAEMGQLFRPYARLQAASTRKGSGLGLYITKSIIEAHGGTLRLEPHTEEGEGQNGTTFSFDLPFIQ